MQRLSLVEVRYSLLGMHRFLIVVEDPWGRHLSALDFPGGSDGKESACSLGAPGLTLGWGRSPGEGNDNPLQYSCLENSMNRGAWLATVHGLAKSWT